jgi:hypothetical protein
VIDFFIVEGEQLICAYECFLRKYGDAALYVCMYCLVMGMTN